MTAATGVLGDARADVGARPTALLPIPQLVRISLYWLGLTAIDAAVGLFITNRLEFDHFVPQENVGTTLFLGRDRRVPSRHHRAAHGRLHQRLHRQPLGTPQAVHRVRIAAGRGVPAGHRDRQHASSSLAAFVILLSFSTNIARGPFQGYVPGPRRRATGRPGQRPRRDDADHRQRHRVPARVAVRAPTARWACACVAVAIVELVTMLSVVLRVGKGLPPKPREGRSWAADRPRGLGDRHPAGAVATCGCSISRLLFLTGGALLANFVVIYLSRDLRDVEGRRRTTMNVAILVIVIVVANVIAIIPASRLSDEMRREPPDLGVLRDRRGGGSPSRRWSRPSRVPSSEPRCSAPRAACSSQSTRR